MPHAHNKRRKKKLWTRGERATLLVALSAMVMTCAWVFVPVPSWIADLQQPRPGWPVYVIFGVHIAVLWMFPAVFKDPR